MKETSTSNNSSVKSAEVSEKKTHKRSESWLNQVRGLFNQNKTTDSPTRSSTPLIDSLERMDLDGIEDYDGQGYSIGIETDNYLIERLDKEIETDLTMIAKSRPVEKSRVKIVRDSSKTLISKDSSSSPTPRRANVTRIDDTKRTRFSNFACLLDAVWSGDKKEVTKILEQEGLHPDTCNADGVTALHCVAASSNLALAEYLLEMGANVNVADDHGWTPLHSSAYNNDYKMTELFLEYNADVEAQDSRGSSPLDLPTNVDLLRILANVFNEKLAKEWVTALYDFNKESVENGKGDELCFQKGDLLQILGRDEEDWWYATYKNQTGYIPRQFVQ